MNVKKDGALQFSLVKSDALLSTEEKHGAELVYGCDASYSCTYGVDVGGRPLRNSCFQFALLTVSSPLKKDPLRFFPLYKRNRWTLCYTMDINCLISI